MSHVFPRHCKLTYPIAVAGDGCYLIDAEGKRYLDASGGAAVSCLGHSDAGLREAIKSQVDQLAFAHTGFFSSEPAEHLAERLVAHAPAEIDRVYFVSGGSEAVEAGIKLARQYFLEKGEPQRTRLIARHQSYHGNTLGALATGGNQWRRKPFAPLLIETRHISPCYAYRGQAADESEYDYGQRVANELEAELLQLGPQTVMAFVAEPVVGATAGAVPAVQGYFKRIREICDQYGILLLLDEVMCGMGRTGTLFACEQDGIRPDIITIAKGLGAGYQPIGAMLCSAKIYQTIEQGSGFFQHGHTYMGHATACAAGNAVLDALLGERQVLSQVSERGMQLEQVLRQAFAQHPHVGDIRGRGLFRGVELVADRDSKMPFDPKLALHKRIKVTAFANGLICYPMGGTVDGEWGDHILLAPPFIITESQLDELVSKLSSAIDQAIVQVA